MKKLVMFSMLFMGLSMTYAFNSCPENVDATDLVEVIKSKVDGAWNGSIETQNGLLSFTITYKVQDEIISGVINSEYGELPFSDGKVTGDSFEYSFDINEVRHTHKGKLVKADEILINYSGGPGVEGEFTMTRAAK
ncbi:hypothetical protein DHD05_08420 [Arenibacter sp. N53]|uniref:hypothetical protein n=1 Tax=Arenibacter TaxID=178469 RepID=UPI000CD447E5|nr:MULTISPECIES: hypothetical protein [Arenibacter]MCM4151611.1 hypothetical protein [Arenibacter sp. N53]